VGFLWDSWLSWRVVWRLVYVLQLVGVLVLVLCRAGVCAGDAIDHAAVCWCVRVLVLVCSARIRYLIAAASLRSCSCRWRGPA